MSDLPEMPVMPTGSNGNGREDEPAPAAPAAARVETAPAEPTKPAPAPAATGGAGRTAPARAEGELVRTAEQLVSALSDPAARGGVFRVPADADWDVPPTAVRASGSWRVVAEAGETRPRLRFLPAEDDEDGPPAWSAMIALGSGSLQIEGVDVVLPLDRAPRRGRWVAFALGPASDLSLTRCTVTVEGDRTQSAVVAVAGADGGGLEPEGAEAPGPAAITVRVADCLIRSGGDFADVEGGRRLALEMDDTAVATRGCLVRAHGAPRARAAETLGVALRQVTARVRGGLVRLESTPAEPELPVADVNARYSVLATGPKDAPAPLFLVDGQDAPASTHDRIRWSGLGVAYHLLNWYRRDQSSQLGAAPTLYDKSSWTVAVGPREKEAVHGDLKFSRDPGPSLPAWSLGKDAFRLDDDSPARAAGSDLARVPDPPAP